MKFVDTPKGPRHVVFGIVSYSIGDCASDIPNVYTNVMNYIRWIHGVIGFHRD